MLTSLCILVAAILVGLMEVPRMLRNRWTRELLVFGALLLAGTSACMMHALRIPLPNPMEFTIRIYQPVSDMLNHLLGLEGL